MGLGRIHGPSSQGPGSRSSRGLQRFTSVHPIAYPAPSTTEAGRLERPSQFVLVAYFTQGYVVPQASHKGMTLDARSGRIPWRNTDGCRSSLPDHAEYPSDDEKSRKGLTNFRYLDNYLDLTNWRIRVAYG
jgi:hypothetical protein